MKFTERVKIVTGLKCNIQCVFCYYRDNLKAPNRSFDEVRRDLDYAWRQGIRQVDFSGGEPTIHPDLPRLISQAKSIGFDRVSVISNGLRLADKSYMSSLKDAGLDEILFSVHGSHEGVHDQITTVKGSFGKISQALSHAAAENVMIRTNTVVNRLNYQDLSKVSAFVSGFKPYQVNFITINDWCFAKHLVNKLMLPYSEMQEPLKQACALLEPLVSAVNVRYIPFCFMDGYERFVCNHKQVPYDLFEWVPRIRTRLEVQNNLWRYLGILGYGFFFGGAFRKTLRVPFSQIMDESVTEALRHWYYTKHYNCRDCRFEKICDGVENTYAKKYGLAELTPREGTIVEIPYHYRINRKTCERS